MKVKNQYLKILEYFLRLIKKRICKSSLKYVDFCTQYLIGAPLAQTPASVRCGFLNFSKIYESFTFWNKLQEKINFFTIF